MLDVLRRIEQQMSELLADRSAWKTLKIDYHPPYVDRVWRQVGDVRVCLHQIHPCERSEALFHPHPWPSAMRLCIGMYEMAIGYGPGDVPPPEAALIVLSSGSAYEMTDPDSWHYVRPLSGKTMSLMVTGKPWNRPAPHSSDPLGPLSDKERENILSFFGDYYRDSIRDWSDKS